MGEEGYLIALNVDLHGRYAAAVCNEHLASMVRKQSCLKLRDDHALFSASHSFLGT